MPIEIPENYKRPYHIMYDEYQGVEGKIGITIVSKDDDFDKYAMRHMI